MDYNEYYIAWLIKQRVSELQAAARRAALLRDVPLPRHPLRVALGTALIRLGAWLLREEYASPSAT